MDALKRAVEIAGNPNALAKRLGRRQSTVWYWLNTPGSKVSAEDAADIERALHGKVTAAELRPDLAAIFAPAPPVAPRKRKPRAAA